MNTASIHPVPSLVPPRVLWSAKEARRERRPYTVTAFMLIFVPIAAIGVLGATSLLLKGALLGVSLALIVVAATSLRVREDADEAALAGAAHDADR